MPRAADSAAAAADPQRPAGAARPRAASQPLAPRGEQPASPSPLARGVKRAASPLPDDAPRPPVNRVKRPMNPFMMYCAAVRPLIKQKFGRLTSQAISKHAAEMWRLEPESVRDGFREMSRIAHERHAELNPDFVWMPSYGGRVNLAARSVSETRKNNRKLACRVGKKTDPLHSDVSVAAVPLMPLLAGQSALQQMASSPSMLPAAPTLASLDALVAASSSAAPAFVAEPETFDPLLEVWNRDEPHVSAHRHSWKSFESLDQSNVSHPAFGQAFHALGNAQTMPAMPRSLPETDHFAPLLNALSGQSTPSLTASSFGSSTGSLSFYGSPSGVSYMPAVSAPQPIIAASYSMGASSFASLADPQIGNYPGATSEPIVAAPTNAKQDSPVHLNSDKMLAALFQSDFKIGTVATAAQPGSSSALIDKAFAKMTPMRAPADVGLPMKTSGYDQHHAVSHSGIDGSKVAVPTMAPATHSSQTAPSTSATATAQQAATSAFFVRPAAVSADGTKPKTKTQQPRSINTTTAAAARPADRCRVTHEDIDLLSARFWLMESPSTPRRSATRSLFSPMQVFQTFRG